jgi:hypothetical protein
VRLESVDEKQYKALEKFKKECLAKGLIDTYDSTAEFRQTLVRQLAQTMLRDVLAAKGVEELPPQRQPPLPALCDEAKQLLLETEQDDHGTALKTLSSGGFCVQANGKILIDTRDPRARARWEEAFQQLEENDLLRDRGYKGEVFGMTAAGYEMAALLREGQK